MEIIIAEFNINATWLRTRQGEMLNEGMSAVVTKAMSVLRPLDKEFQDGALKILITLA